MPTSQQYMVNIFPYLQSRTRINLLAFEKFPGVSYLLSGHLLGRIFWMTAVLASATGNWLWLFFTLLHISKFEAYLFRGGNYSFGSITGSLKYVILRSQRSLLSTPGAAYFSLSIFADWKAVRTVTSLSSAVSRQACSSHHQIVIWIWQTQPIYK